MISNNMKGPFCIMRFRTLVPPAPVCAYEVVKFVPGVCMMSLVTWLPDSAGDTTSLIWPGGGGGDERGSSSCWILSRCGWVWFCPHLKLSPDVSGILTVTGDTLTLRCREFKWSLHPEKQLPFQRLPLQRSHLTNLSWITFMFQQWNTCRL